MLIYKHLVEENNGYFVYMNTQGNKQSTSSLKI